VSSWRLPEPALPLDHVGWPCQCHSWLQKRWWAWVGIFDKGKVSDWLAQCPSVLHCAHRSSLLGCRHERWSPLLVQATARASFLLHINRKRKHAIHPARRSHHINYPWLLCSVVAVTAHMIQMRPRHLESGCQGCFWSMLQPSPPWPYHRIRWTCHLPHTHAQQAFTQHNKHNIQHGCHEQDSVCSMQVSTLSSSKQLLVGFLLSHSDALLSPTLAAACCNHCCCCRLYC
jgi:hypothetical protein